MDNESDKSFRQLIVKMQTEYSCSEGYIYQIYEPVVGMPVAALYQVEKMWYRAEIVEVLKDLRVKVFFVDYGNVDTVTLTELRFLRQEFLIDDVLVFKCRLFGISFNNEQAASQVILNSTSQKVKHSFDLVNFDLGIRLLLQHDH